MIDNSLLLQIAVSVVIGGIIIYYFSKRMVELNKKTNAMFEVVQALSKENEQRKITEYNQKMMQQNGGQNSPPVSDKKELIPVNDNLNEESSDDEQDLDSDSDSVDDSDSDSENDSENDSDEENNDEEFRNKIQNGITVGSEVLSDDVKSLESLENTVKVVDITQNHGNNDEYTGESDSESESESESEEEEEEQQDGQQRSESDDDCGNGEQSVEQNENVIDELDINNLSNINIEQSNNNSLADKNVDVIDYKKTPVKILREIVQEKGLISDPSKVKKAELLKLLQSE